MLIPFGENTRYDLVVDSGKRLARVQCKTARLRAGAVVFATCSCYGHHRNPSRARRDYQGQIDFFAVYCADTAGVYLLPVHELPNRSSCALRVDPPRNNQRDRVRLAARYKIADVRVSVIAEPRASSGAG